MTSNPENPQKLSELYEALNDSRREDAIILGEIEVREREKRTRRRRTVAAAAILALMIVALSCRICGLGDAGGGGQREISASSIDEVDALIASMPEALRGNGSAEDFRKLSDAYGKRYSLSGEKLDRNKQMLAAQKAAVLETKLIKEGSMRNTTVFLAVLLILVIAALSSGMVIIYNRLARSDENVDNRWSQIQTVLQRRLDLVPNLIDAVKGYTQHEQETLIKVTEARAKLQAALEGTGTSAPRTAAAAALLDRSSNELGAALSRLMAVVENYPDLKASSNFLAFQDQLEGTENRIAVERQRYNDAVRAYNAGMRTFPGNLVARSFGFSARSYFEAEAEAQKSPRSNFAK